MKPLAEQSHYDVLEIEPDAPPEDVERAYRIAQATFAEDSLATYSLLDEDDARALRDRLELAYEVLSDAATRHRYDAGLGGAAALRPREDDALLLPLPVDPEPAPPRARPLAAPAIPFEELEEGGYEAPFDGARLRRARLARGLELDQIAATTKINPTYLHFLEEERFDALPAAVYVRGFVSAYARCLGLDPGRVSASYMERVQQHRDELRAARARGA